MVTTTHPEVSDGLTGPPDLLVVDLVELLLEIISVCLSGVELERSAGLGTVSDGFVESLKDGKVSPSGQPGSVFASRLQKRLPMVIASLWQDLSRTIMTTTHSLNLGAQSRAPRRAVVEHALYM
jgi:hypothetical protein